MTIAPLLASLLATLVGAPVADSPPITVATVFDDFTPQAEFPPADVVRTVLRPVEGYPGEISQSSKLERPTARFAGLLRYDEVWPAGSALRISLVDVQSLQIHVWAGEHGVSLRFRPEAGRSGAQWAVYGATRQGQSPRPEQLTLWATDEGRFRRTGEGTFELHWSDDLLAMTRGDAVLWRVPLASPPTEVLFDGSAIVRGLGAFRSPGLRPEGPDLPLVRDVPRPADLDWHEDLPPGLVFTKLPEGGAQLSAADRSKAGQVFASPGPAGLHEFLFELENPQAGTGVYLGDESGEPLARVGFFRSRGRAGLAFGLVANKASDLERSHPEAAAIPYAGSRQWLRLTLAAGIARLWTSGDGRHWSQPPESTMRAAGGCRTVGLYCMADQSARSLRLRSLQVRRLDALAALAPAAVVEQVHVRPVRNSRGRSFAGPSGERPADVSEEVWRRAMALRALIDCPNSGVGQTMLAQLLREAIQSSRPVDDCLRLLAQAARITENGESGHAAALGGLYDLLGRRLMAQRDGAPFTRIRKAMIEAPLGGPPASTPYASASGQLLRYQLLLAVYEGRWDDLGQQCREFQYWSRSRTGIDQSLPAWEQSAGPVIDWASAQLEAQRRSRQAQEGLAAPPPGKDNPQPPPPPLAALAARGRKGRSPRPASLADTTHPLIDRLGKEAYNVAADLEAALAGGSLREACQIIRGAGDTAGGLVPGDDPQLRVSLQVAVGRAFTAHPEMAQTMEQAFGALADLRFKQAVDVPDSAAVESLADQFPGTRAARLAHQWLGDRALAAGQFPQALSRYRQALASAPAADQPAAAARLRLAEAILGKSLGDPLSSAVEFGDTRMPAAEFEQLIAALRAGPASTEVAGLGPSPAQRERVARNEPGEGTRSRDEPGRLASPPSPPTPLPQAGEGSLFRQPPIEIQPWAQIPVGPEQRGWSPRRPLDLAARQTAIRVSAQRMLVSTPARLMAFNLADGRLAWTQSFQNEPNRFQPAAGPMEPIVIGPRILLRRFAGRAGQLVCLGLSDGNVIWTSTAEAPVVSDPVPAGSYVFALVAAAGQAGQLAIQVAEFDLATGRLLARWPAVELRDVWQGSASGRLTWSDDHLLATIGGCVIACDSAGRVRWVRRQTFVAPQIDAYQQSRPARSHEAPLVLQGRVYATQPGVWAVECLDLATGRLLWRRAEPDLVSLVGVDAQHVVLATGTGLVGLDSTSGKQLWSHEDLDPLEAGAFLDGSTVLHATLQRSSVGPPELLIEWLNSATGAVSSRAPLPLALDRRAAFGPLALGAGRLWAILAHGEDPQRQIVQLKPSRP